MAYLSLSKSTAIFIYLTNLVEHSQTQLRECLFLPKTLMSTNNFFFGLVLGCACYGKNRLLFKKIKFIKSKLIKSYLSNILKRILLSDELRQYWTWNFCVENQNRSSLIHFTQLIASLIKKLITHNDFIDKNLYPAEWAKLSSTSVVILTRCEFP